MFNAIAGCVVVAYIFFGFHAAPVPKIIFKTSSGTASFVSEAPLETIKAGSRELKGIIDTSKNTFAFSVAINSFKGFNNPLQQQHFYENYLESSEFPVATFSGKIIEIIDFNKKGIFNVRAKGILNIHGVKSERIIRTTVEIKVNEILIKSSFPVSLQEHNIKIPRIVFQKIAPEILINIEAILSPFQI